MPRPGDYREFSRRKDGIGGIVAWMKRLVMRSAPALTMISTMHPGVATAQKVVADTPFLLLGSEPGESGGIVKRNDAIVSTRMVYAVMATADDDIRGVDGKVIGASPLILAPKGAQLFGVIARRGDHKIYCAVNHKPKGALEGIFVINADKHACFIDADGDGKFDHSYDLRTKFSQLIPIYYDAETVGNPLTVVAGYSTLAPERCQLPMWLDIFVQKISNQGRSVTIGVRMRTGEGATQFTFTKQLNLTAGDQAVGILGAHIVVSRHDNTTVSAKVIRGIARQDFSTDRPDQRIIFIMI